MKLKEQLNAIFLKYLMLKYDHRIVPFGEFYQNSGRLYAAQQYQLVLFNTNPFFEYETDFSDSWVRNFSSRFSVNKVLYPEEILEMQGLDIGIEVDNSILMLPNHDYLKSWFLVYRCTN